MSIRTDANGANPNELPTILQRVSLGELLTFLIAATAATETAIAVTTNVATLANQPSELYDAVAVAATTAGTKKIRKGPITGPSALVPATGECVWDGGTKVLFAAVDAVTTATFRYPRATTKASLLETDLINA